MCVVAWHTASFLAAYLLTSVLAHEKPFLGPEGAESLLGATGSAGTRNHGSKTSAEDKTIEDESAESTIKLVKPKIEPALRDLEQLRSELDVPWALELAKSQKEPGLAKECVDLQQEYKEKAKAREDELKAEDLDKTLEGLKKVGKELTAAKLSKAKTLAQKKEEFEQASTVILDRLYYSHEVEQMSNFVQELKQLSELQKEADNADKTEDVVKLKGQLGNSCKTTLTGILLTKEEAARKNKKQGKDKTQGTASEDKAIKPHPSHTNQLLPEPQLMFLILALAAANSGS